MRDRARPAGAARDRPPGPQPDPQRARRERVRCGPPTSPASWTSRPTRPASTCASWRSTAWSRRRRTRPATGATGSGGSPTRAGSASTCASSVSQPGGKAAVVGVPAQRRSAWAHRVDRPRLLRPRRPRTAPRDGDRRVAQAHQGRGRGAGAGARRRCVRALGRPDAGAADAARRTYLVLPGRSSPTRRPCRGVDEDVLGSPRARPTPPRRRGRRRRGPRPPRRRARPRRPTCGC